jgi:hypothetical protein
MLATALFLDDMSDVATVERLTFRGNNITERLDFQKQLDDIEVDEENPVRIIRPCNISTNGDSWDICIKVYIAATGQPLHVFFDCKSGAEYEPAMTSKVVNVELQNATQFHNTASSLGSSRQMIYVYLSTHVDIATRVLLSIPSTSANGEDDREAVGSESQNARKRKKPKGDTAVASSRICACAVLGRMDTLNLLGPYSEVYRVARATLSNSL